MGSSSSELAPEQGAGSLSEGRDPPRGGEAAEGGDEVERSAWRVSAGALRLDQCLAAQPQAYSRGHAQQLIASGAVRLAGRPCNQAARRPAPGQLIEVEWWPPQAEQACLPEPLALTIVHEDASLLVIDKPVGLVVHPAAGHWSGTLMNGLLAHHAGAQTLPRAGIVHRLDKDTSGLMVVAKTLAAYHALVEAISARRVQREYLALCQRDWHEPLSVEMPIGRDPRSRVRMAVVPEGAGGKPARTDFTPLAHDPRFSLLHCRLHSGRTHQIRVHAARQGHALVADALYGGVPALGLTRQALHATRLALAHPLTGDWMCWHSPLTADLQQACAALWPGLDLSPAALLPPAPTMPA